MFPALVTPFKNGGFDEPGYRKLIDYVLDNGADGVVPNGTTGENPTLTQAERQAIISIAVEMCHRQGKKVIAGAGNFSTAATIDLVNDAQKLGADAALVITPYYNKPTQDGLLLHFRAVADNTNLPIIMYTVPSRTAVNMTAETVIELSREKNIAGLKEASGDLVQFATIAANTADEFVMLSGEDGLTLPSLTVGGMGVITVVGNAAPRLTKDMLDCWNSGDIVTAFEIHARLLPLIKALFTETSPSPCKKALEMLGICAAEPRLPLAPVRPETERLLKDALTGLGLI